MSTLEKTTLKSAFPLSIICEEDPQEKRFEQFIKLWVNDEISYSELMKNYPTHEASMLKKILSFITEKIN